MKLVFKISMAAFLALNGVVSHAQDCSSGIPNTPPRENCRMIGKVSFGYAKKPVFTSVGIGFYLLGKPGDVIPSVNTMRVENDVIIMSIGYFAERNIVPYSATIELRTFSTKPLKHRENHKLTIFIDDKTLLSENLDETGSLMNAENFAFTMKYSDFLSFTAVSKVVIQIGETKIELKPDAIEALNEMNKTTKDLSPPPPSWM